LDKFLPLEVRVVKIVLRERESAQEAVRRFRKIVERSGLKRELRRRERYEKPSDIRRKAKNRAIRRSKAQAMQKVAGRP
jgi:small subunit ribosomal protein S21